MTNNPACLDDFESHAASVLPRLVFDHYRSAAGDELSLAWNREAFDKFVLRPRMLRDVSKLDTSTKVLGHEIRFPVCIAPTSLHCMAHPDGERATIRAAAAAGTCMTLSTFSTTRLEDVAEAGGENAHRWFQLYIGKDRALAGQLVRRAETSGFSALVLTVDTPEWGRHLADIRNDFRVPSHLTFGNLVEKEQFDRLTEEQRSRIYEHTAPLFRYYITWDDVKWLQSFSRLPVLLKGILTAEDARIAADIGVAGIVVSNHGGRQLDSVAATMDALPEVVRAVAHKPQCEVFVDGGVRTGSDVVKALILGARAVFIGRPVLWALAHSGETGVRKMLSLLEEEFRLALTLIGASSIADLKPDMIALKQQLPKL